VWHAQLKTARAQLAAMAYFTTSKLVQLAETRAARGTYVSEAERAAADNVYLVEHVVKRALPLARDEARAFLDAFGEPLPDHLRRSLEAEVDLWERLVDGLTTLAHTQITADTLDVYTSRVRSYLACQADLLRMQQEMVSSCLVDHYDKVRESILARAAAYDITTI
jgi:hypothetical protein